MTDKKLATLARKRNLQLQAELREKEIAYERECLRRTREHILREKERTSRALWRRMGFCDAELDEQVWGDLLYLSWQLECLVRHAAR